MGLMDKAKKALKGRSGMVEKGIDRAAGAADKRTKGKYGDKLSSGAEQLKERARQLDEERARGAGPAGTAPTSGTEPTPGTEQPPPGGMPLG